MSNDNFGLWGALIGVGIYAICAKSAGKKEAYKEIADRERDLEIEKLRKQVAEMKGMIECSNQ